MKIKELLEEGIKQLKEEKIEEAPLKGKMLLSYLLKVNKIDLLINQEEQVKKKIEEDFLVGIKNLKQHIPIQHLIKHQEFMKLSFYVDKKVLIPRPDTEILVEEVLDIIKKKKKRKVQVLDLCTGSGAIGIAIAYYEKDSNVIGIDISKDAIAIASKNAKDNQVKNIQFLQSNLFLELSYSTIEEKTFDVIVSNPPYIKTNEIQTLTEEVRKEPILALDGGENGLDFYKEIIKQSSQYLKRDGFLCLEIGYDQKQEVIELIKNTHQYEEIIAKRDLNGKDRIIICKKKG